MRDEILRLRDKRGAQRVSFDQVADHMADYARLHPDARPMIDGLARFLADVEDRPHPHDGRQERAARREFG